MDKIYAFTLKNIALRKISLFVEGKIMIFRHIKLIDAS